MLPRLTLALTSAATPNMSPWRAEAGREGGGGGKQVGGVKGTGEGVSTDCSACACARVRELVRVLGVAWVHGCVCACFQFMAFMW
jgi:hypothetical protein